MRFLPHVFRIRRRPRPVVPVPPGPSGEASGPLEPLDAASLPTGPVPDGARGIPDGLPSLPFLKRTYQTSRRRQQVRERKWEKIQQRRDFIMLHPGWTRFRRMWTRRGRDVTRRKKALQVLLQERRQLLDLLLEEQWRRDEPAVRREQVADWREEEDERIRRNTYHVFRLMEPETTEESVERRIRDHWTTADRLPIEMIPEETDDGGT